MSHLVVRNYATTFVVVGGVFPDEACPPTMWPPVQNVRSPLYRTYPRLIRRETRACGHRSAQIPRISAAYYVRVEHHLTCTTVPTAMRAVCECVWTRLCVDKLTKHGTHNTAPKCSRNMRARLQSSSSFVCMCEVWCTSSRYIRPEEI